MEFYVLVVSSIIVVIALLLILSYFHNPFQYPHIIIDFDISKKRKPVYEDYIDEWINKLHRDCGSVNDEFDRILREWDNECKHCILCSILWKSHRENIYQSMREQVVQSDYEMFQFIFSRNQTRYRQQNYKKYAYTVQNTEKILAYTLKEMLAIAKQLDGIDYETTRSKWFSKNQRKLMTDEIRLQIKIRDNYTCQMCGKYMPDEVGLHIDHIIPIKKGGKSIESNLQVLCDKCNWKKSSK